MTGDRTQMIDTDNDYDEALAEEYDDEEYVPASTAERIGREAARAASAELTRSQSVDRHLHDQRKQETEQAEQSAMDQHLRPLVKQLDEIKNRIDDRSASTEDLSDHELLSGQLAQETLLFPYRNLPSENIAPTAVYLKSKAEEAEADVASLPPGSARRTLAEQKLAALLASLDELRQVNQIRQERAVIAQLRDRSLDSKAQRLARERTLQAMNDNLNELHPASSEALVLRDQMHAVERDYNWRADDATIEKIKTEIAPDVDRQILEIQRQQIQFSKSASRVGNTFTETSSSKRRAYGQAPRTSDPGLELAAREAAQQKEKAK